MLPLFVRITDFALEAASPTILSAVGVQQPCRPKRCLEHWTKETPWRPRCGRMVPQQGEQRLVIVLSDRQIAAGSHVGPRAGGLSLIEGSRRQHPVRCEWRQRLNLSKLLGYGPPMLGEIAKFKLSNDLRGTHLTSVVSHEPPQTVALSTPD